MKKILSSSIITIAFVGIIVVISSIIAGCFDNNQEKSYEYYTAHPEELMQDFKFCAQHPSNNKCNNIVNKYYRYQQTHHLSNALISNNHVFNNIDN